MGPSLFVDRQVVGMVDKSDFDGTWKTMNSGILWAGGGRSVRSTRLIASKTVAWNSINLYHHSITFNKSIFVK